MAGIEVDEALVLPHIVEAVGDHRAHPRTAEVVVVGLDAFPGCRSCLRGGRSPVLCIPDDECSIARHETQGTEVLPELSAPAGEVGRPRARLKALESHRSKYAGATGRGARKDSSTSSKPPSSDIVKPPRPPLADEAAGVRQAARSAMPSTNAPPSRPKQVQAGFDYRVDVCPDCGQALEPSAIAPRRAAGRTPSGPVVDRGTPPARELLPRLRQGPLRRAAARRRRTAACWGRT